MKGILQSSLWNLTGRQKRERYAHHRKQTWTCSPERRAHNTQSREISACTCEDKFQAPGEKCTLDDWNASPYYLRYDHSAWQIFFHSLQISLASSSPGALNLMSERYCAFRNLTQWSPLITNNIRISEESLTNYKSSSRNTDLDNLDKWRNGRHNQCCRYQICCTHTVTHNRH